MARQTTVARISDPTTYPYAIVSKAIGSPADRGFALHVIEGPSTLGDWQQLVAELLAAGGYEYVMLTTMNFQEHESGRPLGA
ncbi:hypothetical protein [Miltoncostaea oceani]|uniref:hypothetical protein n=1 Tax=Miltoncostaea oceani TaxID=2843216 RepID=UPI001C3DFE26|nr:hypothetical protein [Miltoncostaea oceani]